MLNRLKNFAESIVYAGMKPAVRSAEGAPAAKPGFFARILNGPAVSDPLYFTNQTFGQKARRMLLLASPVILVLAGGALAIKVLAPTKSKAPKPLTNAELRAKVLPEFNRPITLEANQDIEVTEVHFEHTGGNSIVGNIRNKGTHQIVEATMVFELADPANSGLGAVTVRETNLPPGTSRTFRMPIEQANATYAMVREVDTR
jgi:hypothetical protein